MTTGAKTSGMFLVLILKYKKMFSIFQLKKTFQLKIIQDCGKGINRRGYVVGTCILQTLGDIKRGCVTGAK